MARDHLHLAALAGASLGGTGGGAVKRAKALFVMGLLVALFSAITMLRSWGSSDGHGKEEDSALGAVADEGLYSRRVSTFQDAKRNQSGLVDAGRCFLTNSGSVKAHCLPSLVCIGAMKAGTFELKQWLEEHPLVAAASKPNCQGHHHFREDAVLPGLDRGRFGDAQPAAQPPRGRALAGPGRARVLELLPPLQPEPAPRGGRQAPRGLQRRLRHRGALLLQ
eukprot:CAMPEP_0171883710 /NCGR_PEP_ID=MMETSP0992-20121227/40330_1 /TAXON_ID=483369 /ORGANISM="non described non described, Strain CCMP2098" /LENGTH=221 /DNA_ID=CAMNT_0012509955 /DNA_START=60 /DNA_END=722 /DNA_ORIENTATION=-